MGTTALLIGSLFREKAANSSCQTGCDVIARGQLLTIGHIRSQCLLLLLMLLLSRTTGSGCYQKTLNNIMEKDPDPSVRRIIALHPQSSS